MSFAFCWVAEEPSRCAEAPLSGAARAAGVFRIDDFVACEDDAGGRGAAFGCCLGAAERFVCRPFDTAPGDGERDRCSWRRRAGFFFIASSLPTCVRTLIAIGSRSVFPNATCLASAGLAALEGGCAQGFYRVVASATGTFHGWRQRTLRSRRCWRRSCFSRCSRCAPSSRRRLSAKSNTEEARVGRSRTSVVTCFRSSDTHTGARQCDGPPFGRR